MWESNIFDKNWFLKLKYDYNRIIKINNSSSMVFTWLFYNWYDTYWWSYNL